MLLRVIVRAPEPPLPIPDVSLTALLLDRATRYGDKPAFIDGPSGRTLTFADWRRNVGIAATGLRRLGVTKGDIVGICSPNVPEFTVVFHAMTLVGAVPTLASPLSTAEELRRQLDATGARSLFGSAPGATPFAPLLDHGEAPDFTNAAAAGDLAVLPLSSGTSGQPKPVMLTHRNLVANTLQATVALDVRTRDVVLGVLPFFHIYGLSMISVAVHQGTTVVLMPRFDLQEALALMRRYDVTYMPVVPPIVLGLAKHPSLRSQDLPNLRVVLSGAAPLDNEIAAEVSRRLECPVVQGYGLTETSPVTHATRISDARGAVPGVGLPVPNTESTVVDVETGRPCDPLERGEIWVRGPQVMRGYLNRPEDTAAVMTPDGWLRTGDVGYADEIGRFFIVDRLKELIKYKGHPVAPAELEAVLLGHPAIADAAVVPQPDAESGEVPKAFVVLRAPVDAREIMEYVAERLGRHKRLHGVEFISQIPRSPAGKILRRMLLQR